MLRTVACRHFIFTPTKSSYQQLKEKRLQAITILFSSVVLKIKTQSIFIKSSSLNAFDLIKCEIIDAFEYKSDFIFSETINLNTYIQSMSSQDCKTKVHYKYIHTYMHVRAFVYPTFAQKSLELNSLYLRFNHV